MVHQPDNKAVKGKDQPFLPDKAAAYILRCPCGQRHEVPLNGVAVRCPDCGTEMCWPPKGLR